MALLSRYTFEVTLIFAYFNAHTVFPQLCYKSKKKTQKLFILASFKACMIEGHEICNKVSLQDF